MKIFNLNNIFFYLLAILLIGIGYISILPPFEGFDETAHYSRLRESKDDSFAILKSKSFLDKSVVEYSGPMPYSSGNAPFDRGLTYERFFSDKNSFDGYVKKYWHDSMSDSFVASANENWQYQHPPLYYLLLSPITIKSIPFIYQFYIIRIISFFIARVGVFFGLLSIYNISKLKGAKNDLDASFFGFMIYPIMFPMFFLEFARIGNDSLCLLISGLIFYVLTRNYDSLFPKVQLILIGCLLGLGLLTKALFIPITAAIIFFFTLKELARGINLINVLKLFKMFLLILTPALIIGGSWYLFKFFVYDDPGLGTEVLDLESQSAFFTGLVNHFSLIKFVKDILVPLVTFVWAGSWSLVRMPEYLELPLLFFGFGLLASHLRDLKNKEFKSYHWLGVLMFIFIYIGLVAHVTISTSLSGFGTSPGWYLHILTPWLASTVGLASFRLMQSKLSKRVFYVLLLYSFIFQLIALWSHLALFSGCASKATNKHFIFSGELFCLNNIQDVFGNLGVIAFPHAGMAFLLTGFFILAYLIIGTLKNFNVQSKL